MYMGTDQVNVSQHRAAANGVTLKPYISCLCEPGHMNIVTYWRGSRPTSDALKVKLKQCKGKFDHMHHRDTSTLNASEREAQAISFGKLHAMS